MQRIKDLNRYQQAILLIMLAMVLIFAVVYPVTISRVGFAYLETIFVPSQEAEGTVYSGKLNGLPSYFTVTRDKTVVFQYGDQTYGPYTARKDPTAIPEEDLSAKYMTGVELRKGEAILFRGGVHDTGESLWLTDEDGSLNSFVSAYTSSDGLLRDGEGSIIDPIEPSAATILSLMGDPELTHKGIGLIWFLGLILCAVNAVTILYADELFRWHLSFRIYNVQQAEPSEWEIMSRYLSWTILPVLALIIFIIGLK